MPPRSRDSYDHTHAAADSLGTRWSLIHRFPSFVTRVFDEYNVLSTQFIYTAVLAC